MHTIGLLRHQGSQKNCKRPIKVMKAKSKARHYRKSKFYTFFICLWSFAANWSEINFGLYSKVIKRAKFSKIQILALKFFGGENFQKFFNFFTFGAVLFLCGFISQNVFPKRPQSGLKAAPKRLQSSPKAVPKRPQSAPKAWTILDMTSNPLTHSALYWIQGVHFHTFLFQNLLIS